MKDYKKYMKWNDECRKKGKNLGRCNNNKNEHILKIEDRLKKLYRSSTQQVPSKNYKTLKANETKWTENVDFFYIPSEDKNANIVDYNTYVFWVGTTIVWCK